MDDTPYGSDAESVDEAAHDTQPAETPAAAQPSPSPDDSQDVPVSTDENGEGWGLVGLFPADVGEVTVEGGKGKVELEQGGDGITKLVVTGAPKSTVIHLTVKSKL